MDIAAPQPASTRSWPSGPGCSAPRSTRFGLMSSSWTVTPTERRGSCGRVSVTARRRGAALVLGLRDVLDEPAAVAGELAGAGWVGVADLFAEVLVYGNRVICDHRTEYGLPFEPRYCGWVAGPAAPSERRADPGLVLVAAGGGGDGADVVRLGLDLLRNRSHLRGLIVAGPYGDRVAALDAAQARGLADRVQVHGHSDRMDQLLAGSGAVIQMAGYNSTVESLVAGHRPLLVPRRNPRREQAIRAARSQPPRRCRRGRCGRRGRRGGVAARPSTPPVPDGPG